jgi:hypothetical protein
VDEGRRKLLVGAVAGVLATTAYYVTPARITGSDYLDAVIWLTGLVVAGNVGEWWAKRGGKV